MSIDSNKLLKIIPDIPMEFAAAIHDLGLVLLNDDIHDIGYFTYYGRRHHVYKGKRAPDHPSPFHHWQVAIGMLFAAKFMGMVSLARENLQAYREIELEETLEERTITYNKYMEQISQKGYKKSTIPDPKKIEFNDYEVVDSEEPSGVLPPSPDQRIISVVEMNRPPIPQKEIPIPSQNRLAKKIPKLSIRL